ncbi:MAG: beta-lactamase family protein, partial [Gemmatimonadota bacterium]|nr:beta-lactamase family protein [Gemmatimonadota bacterium]
MIAQSTRPSATAMLAAIALAASPLVLHAQRPAEATTSRHAALEARLADLLTESRAPGIAVGIVWDDGTTLSLAAGMADTIRAIPMTSASRLLQGSVGKTYVAAVAMQLVHAGALDLDAKVAEYLGAAPWLARLPNGHQVTVRQLMNHTSGIVRYEFDDRFIADLLASPDRVWRPEELLAYLFDTEAPFAPGEGWEYSDTNYILLGMIIERLTGTSYYEALRQRILVPLHLENTVPSNTRRIPGLVQGYAGVENPFGLPEAVIVDGTFAINPQFEWTGGGIASTAGDLATWTKALYEGRAFDASLVPVMLDAVPARLGPNTRYGLGVIVSETPLGPSWGHSGFFPGYLAEMSYFPESGLAIAVQVNSSDVRALGLG